MAALFRNPRVVSIICQRISGREMASLRSVTPSKIEEDFWEKQKRLGRPMSPHLSIYKPELPMLTSLAHRVSGLYLSGMLSLSAIGTVLMPGDMQMTLEFLQQCNFGYPIIFTAKLAIALPLCYHALNGWRHLGWDMGKGMAMRELYLTGKIVSVVSVIAALYVASL